MQFNSDSNPKQSAVYLVDRDKQGKWYRYYNADTDTWGFCESEIETAFEAKDKTSPVGFFPWVGPLTGPNYKGKKKVIDDEVALVNVPVADVITKTAKAPKVPKAKKAKATKVAHADGTILYRADRKKYVTFIGGHQVAARPTVEAIEKYLKKNHNNVGTLVK